MIRILTLLLVLALGTPALAWGGDIVPGGIVRVGAVCCGVQTAEEQQEPQDEQQVDRNCCCRPAPVALGVDRSLRAPTTAKSPLAFAAPETTSMLPTTFDAAPGRRLAIPRASSAPPLVQPLLDQKTSLQL